MPPMATFLFYGRGDRNRTCDPLHPMQVLYQAELRPDVRQHDNINFHNLQTDKLNHHFTFPAIPFPSSRCIGSREKHTVFFAGDFMRDIGVHVEIQQDTALRRYNGRK